jgi:hypothetical protein
MRKEGAQDRAYSIFTYDLFELDNLTKVRFVQFLKGRKSNSGFVNELNGEFLVNGCFLIPQENAGQMEMTFKTWKVKYTRREVLMC